MTKPRTHDETPRPAGEALPAGSSAGTNPYAKEFAAEAFDGRDAMQGWDQVPTVADRGSHRPHSEHEALADNVDEKTPKT